MSIDWLIDWCGWFFQEAFLSLIYTNSAPAADLDEHAPSLVVLGEKYQIPDVKDKAVEVLRKSLTLNNAGDLLQLADLHNVLDLKEDVMDFIVRPDNWSKVRETDAWIELRNGNPLLVEQLLDRVQAPKKLKTSLTGSGSHRWSGKFLFLFILGLKLLFSFSPFLCFCCAEFKQNKSSESFNFFGKLKLLLYLGLFFSLAKEWHGVYF